MATQRVAAILSDAWADSPDGTALATALVDSCARALPVTGVGLALMTDRGPAGTVAATDGVALTLEDLQFTLGEGPCIEASTSRGARSCSRIWPPPPPGGGPPSPVAPSLRAWPPCSPCRYGSAPSASGCSTCTATPPGRSARPSCARRSPTPTPPPCCCCTCRPGHRPTALAQGAVHLIDDRAEVHQATGVVSVQAGVGLAEALVLLRARAYAAQRPVSDVARDVLAGALDFTENRDVR